MLTSRLVKFIYDTRFDDIPDEVIEQAKMHLFDTLGAISAGSHQPMGRLIARHVSALGGVPAATVWGHGFKTSPPQAALANGTMAHVLDLDDDSDTIFSHPSATLLPAVLALGELRASGREILTAYIVGEEVSARIARVPGLLPEHYERGWHPTATLGIMGAVAAAAKILRLEPCAIAHALGLAASEASGLRANFASMAKSLHAGNTAAKAVNAALLAQAGVTANPRVLESPVGFLELFGGDRNCNPESFLCDLGRQWDFDSPGLNIKRYPSCYYTHSAVDLLLDAMADNEFKHDEIESLYCGISPIAAKVLIERLPESGQAGKFSLPYCLALAAFHGSLAIPHFEDAYLHESPIQRLMECVHTVTVPELGDDGLGLGARIAVTTQRHGTLTSSKAKPRGGAQDPLSWTELADKFNACVVGILAPEAVATLLTAVRSLENLDRIQQLLSFKVEQPE